ncbi:MAG TPA: urea transporter [Ramlibacter sp.]|uniref:urea transporter n=1 Tax=Ramlibacter sp. TaxID=1917967 RepID=UPI002D7F6B83|nr:urea transporter [Ramlibacter sp.]HET8746387.1 urea transporter [Ramlibacter sp.]
MARTRPAAVSTAPVSAPVRWHRKGLAAAARLLEPLGHALGHLFFIPQPWIGLVLGLALLVHPPYALFALEGFLVGAAINRLLGRSDDPAGGGSVTTNALLASVVTGWLTGSSGIPWSVQVLLAAVAAVPAALLAAAVVHFLARSPMPAVLLGYCMAAAMMFSICPQCTAAASNAMPGWPQLVDARGWGEGMLRALGALMYGRDWISGAFVALAVLLWSRALLACGIAGWIGGALAALAFQRLHLVYYWLPLSYNFFIAGIALGAALFLPGRASLVVAAVAGAMASLFGLALQYALGGSSTSYLPLSSALAIWVGIGALATTGIRPLRPGAAAPPERQWWSHAYWRARLGADVPLFASPVAGEVLVTQGFGGALSHGGALRHALDLERPHVAGMPLGTIFGADVTSPVAGTVERVCNHVADNLPGACNHAQRWGNHVVIRLDGGAGSALLAHLQQGSVAVQPGARVEVGSYLGRVGNSGRSAFAHLHLQLQSAAEPGSPTRPFKLANYLGVPAKGSTVRPWVVSGIPRPGEVVAPAARNPAVFQALAGFGPGAGLWIVESTGEVPRAFRADALQRVDVSIDSLGRHVFTEAGGGTLVACLDPDAWRVVELAGPSSPLLRLLALAVSTIPYAARIGVGWSDLPPLPPGAGSGVRVPLVLAPYVTRPFVRVASECTAEAAPPAPAFEILSRVEARAPGLPLQVRCMLSPLRGPERLRAEFAQGAITFSLLSFAPGAQRPAGPSEAAPPSFNHPAEDPNAEMD